MRRAALVGLFLGVLAPAARAQEVPAIHFHVGAEELVASVYPDRYGDAPELVRRDAEWTRKADADLMAWWDESGPLFLRRASDLAGLTWPYTGIEVYLARYWPVLSIEYPLVVASDAIRGASGTEVDVPEDRDFRVLVLAHQVVHYLIDDPGFLPPERRDPAYAHPFMAPGPFADEAMVNWVVYAVLGEMWGPQRLQRATSRDLWRAYNPSHDFVVDELIPRWSLSATRPLTAWLDANPEGSEIFRVRDAYLRQARTGAAPATPAGPEEGLSGTAYGLDLGSTYDGEVFAAWVDEGSAAARAGVLQGDLLKTIEGREVGRDVTEAQRRLTASWEDNGEINLSVVRGGREVWITIQRR